MRSNPGEQANSEAVALPPQEPSKAPHKVLGVEPDASAEAVKQAYREKAKHRHTDTGGSVEAFKELNEAKEEMLE